MKKLVILGGSGIGRIAAWIASESGEYEVLGFLNDVEEPGTMIGKYKPLPVIGKTADLPEYAAMPDVYFFVAYVGLGREKETFKKIKNLTIPENRLATLIHPTAMVPDSCRVGKGVLMAQYCVISPDVTIEDKCILLAHSFVGHDSTMKEFAHVATNGVVGANVTVGKSVHVGSNAVIREKTTIGDYALIGSGAVVLKDVAENTVVAGNPARLLRRKKADSWITIITPLYRPDNLAEISKTIPDGAHWIVVGQAERKPEYIPENCEYYEIESDRGIHKRNYALKLVKSGFVYFLDDDTIIHPDFYKLRRFIVEYDFVHFNQIFKSGAKRIGGEVKLNRIDMGSFIVKRQVIGDVEFTDHRKADGVFAVEVFKNALNPHYSDINASIYNFLREEK